jgi:hypothetical protein
MREFWSAPIFDPSILERSNFSLSFLRSNCSDGTPVRFAQDAILERSNFRPSVFPEGTRNAESFSFGRSDFGALASG